MSLLLTQDPPSAKRPRPEWWRDVDSPILKPASQAESIDPPLSRLLNLFPAARIVNTPIQVEKPESTASEKTGILAGTADTAIFVVKFPVTSGTTLRIRPLQGSGGQTAIVIALMPYDRGLVVAARFQSVPQWFTAEHQKQKTDARNPALPASSSVRARTAT